MKRLFILIATVVLLTSCSGKLPGGEIVDKYVSEFNAVDSEYYSQVYPNVKAAEFLKNNIPLFNCPDTSLEKTYYFRWWTFRKHIKETPEGYVITEFLPPVGWAKSYNTINCAVQHHINEGRWLKDSTIISDDLKFWLYGSGVHDYSMSLADDLWQYCLVKGDNGFLEEAYPRLCKEYKYWEDNFKDSTGLYWRMDGYDGMECAIGGSYSKDMTGYRPTINSYQYADAVVLSKIAARMNLMDESKKWEEEASIRKKMIDSLLWNKEDQFYEVIPRYDSMKTVNCREELGYIPWIYDIPDEDKGESWKPLFDTMGFMAPYGPTTAERRNPGFKVVYEGHECQWNGPSWPFATSQTLTAMAACYQRFGDEFFTKDQYFDLLEIYSNSHRLGNQCWIDENLNPFTGDWIARTLLIQRGNKIKERGKDYNHSTFCDLVISGLIGVRPQIDGTIIINPMLPENKWKWFSLTNLSIQGKTVNIVYDKSGWHYGLESGFNVYVNGELKFHSDKLESCTIK